MKDYRLDVEVKVRKRSLSPKTGQTQRGPLERNAGVIRENVSVNFVGTDAEIATAVQNALDSVSRQWPKSATEPPQVSALEPATVGETTATLPGMVHPHGTSTVITFEYGTTPELGTSEAADESPSTADEWTAVGVDLTGLTADTQYYFRVKVVASGETRYSGLQTFKTDAAA